MTITASVRGASADYDLLGGGADLVDVAMLASRASAAALRLSLGSPIDAEDQHSLRAIRALFEASAAAVESFGHHRPALAPPTGALAAQVDVAIDAVLHEADITVDAEAITQLFTDLAARVTEALDDGAASSAEGLHGVLSGLAESVLRETAHVGETTSTL